MRSATACLLLLVALILLSSGCSTISVQPVEPPLPPLPPRCEAICPAPPEQIQPGQISSEDYDAALDWGTDCQLRQIECLGWAKEVMP